MSDPVTAADGQGRSTAGRKRSKKRKVGERARGAFHPLTWLIVAVVLLLAYAWHPALYGMYARARWPVPEMPRGTAFTFHALRYEAAGQDPREEAQRAEDHLQALAAAGFHPIGLHDVRRLLREGTPLPPRSVLVTVDSMAPAAGRAWQRQVMRARARAVLFLHADASRAEANRLARAMRIGHWDAGVRVPASALAPSDPTPGTDLLADDPEANLQTARRYQRMQNLRDASEATHQQARTRLRGRLPAAPSAAALPAPPPEPENLAAFNLHREILSETASAFFDLVFRDSGLSLNSAHSDRLRLNRLNVPRNWTGADVVERLRTEAAAEFRVADASRRWVPAAWIPGFGRPGFEAEQGLRLSAPPGELGDGVWLAGSRRTEPMAIRMTYTLDRGTLRLLFLAEPDESARWELRLDAGGGVTLRYEDAWESALIARDTVPASAAPRKLEFQVRGEQLSVRLDERRLFDGWVSLRGRPSEGPMGIRLEAPDGHAGRAHVLAAESGTPDPHVAVWDFGSEFDLYALRWAGRDASRFTALSPPLDRFGESTTPAFGDIPAPLLFRTASRLNQWSLTPHLRLESQEDLRRWTPEALQARIGALDCDGVYVRLGERENWSLADLSVWIRRLAGLLQAQGRELLVGLPDVIGIRLESLPPIATIPGVQLVVGTDASAEVRRGAAIEQRVPRPDAETDLRVYHELVGTRPARAPSPREEDLRVVREQAEAAFSAGEYEEAVTLWFDWHEDHPDHALPLQRIADALERLGFRDEALDFYRQSLDREPGDIGLAIQLAQLLDASGKHEDAWSLLQTYALLFPDAMRITLAQAEWLFRRQRYEESHARVRRVLAQDSEHLPAVLLLAHLARTQEDRRDAVERLSRMGAEEAMRLRVLQTIRAADLLTMPEAGPLLQLILDLADADSSGEVARLLRDLRPRGETVTEALMDRDLSEAWIIDGGTPGQTRGTLRLRAATGRTEAHLRLGGSDRWRDAFVETEVERVQGEFWLTLRRSRDNMVRYGFNETLGQMYLQIWQRDRDRDRMTLKHYRIDAWTRPPGPVRLRIETRGNAAVAYLNDRPWGAPPLPLGGPLSPGWISVGAFAGEPGTAEFSIRHLRAGPLFPCVALLGERGRPAPDPEAGAAAVLRGALRSLNTISPSGFRVDEAGAWQSEPIDDFYRLFARYHGLRFLPQVEVRTERAVRADDVADAARVHRTDGFVFLLDYEPSAAWVTDLHRGLEAFEGDVLLLYPGEEDGRMHMRGVGRARMLFPAISAGASVRRIEQSAAEEAADARTESPVMVVF